MRALELVNLLWLMWRTAGRAEIVVALIDGPVLMANPHDWGHGVRNLAAAPHAACMHPESVACRHGTFIASLLAAKRGSQAAAICPDCTLLLRPIFPEDTVVSRYRRSMAKSGDVARDGMEEPTAAPDELAAAIVESVDAGARVINLSMGLGVPSCKPEPRLQQAMDYAAQHGAIPVVAAGNQCVVGSSALTRHPWTLPVVGCSLNGRPTVESNLGSSSRQRSLRAPGENVMGLGSDGHPQWLHGTSVAAPFVTGTIALLWSEFPQASARDIRLALTQPAGGRRGALVPPLLNGESAYRSLAARMLMK